MYLSAAGRGEQSHRERQGRDDTSDFVSRVPPTTPSSSSAIAPHDSTAADTTAQQGETQWRRALDAYATRESLPGEARTEERRAGRAHTSSSLLSPPSREDPANAHDKGAQPPPQLVESGALTTVTSTALSHTESPMRMSTRPRRAQAVGVGRGGFTGQDRRVRTEASIPLEMVDVVGAAHAPREGGVASSGGERRRVSQSLTRPLADAREARRRRLQREKALTGLGRASNSQHGDGGDDEEDGASADEDDVFSSDADSSGTDQDEGSDEEAVGTGTVISPSTIVCVLSTSTARELAHGLHMIADTNSPRRDASTVFKLPSVRGRRVLTMECGGWLRMRASRTGTVQHQQQLRGGHEATCGVWLLTSSAPSRRSRLPRTASSSSPASAALRHTQPCRLWAVCGLLGGQICVYDVSHDALRAWPRLMPLTVHAEPIVGIVPMHVVRSDSTETGTEGVRRREGRDASWRRRPLDTLQLTSLFLTMDASGQLVLWELSERAADDAAKSTNGGSRTRTSRPHVTCRQYALVDWQDAAAVDAATTTGEHSDALAIRRDQAPQSSSAPRREHAGPAVLADATALNSTGFLLNRPLVATADASSAAAPAARRRSTLCGGTTVYMYTCTASFTRRVQRVEDATTIENNGIDQVADAEGGLPWHCLVRMFHGVDRARDGLITSLCAVRSSRLDDEDEDEEGHKDSPRVRLYSGHVWAGTSGGVLCVWDARTAYLLRRIALPSTSPVHVLSCTGRAATEEVWSCQLDGSVTAWHTRTFQLSQVLPLSYPPLHAQATSRTARTSSGADRPPALRVRDATDLAWALYGDPALAPEQMTTTASSGLGDPLRTWRLGARQHFTLALAALETVRLRRAWTVATDGSVRTWLIPDRAPLASHVPVPNVESAAGEAEETDGDRNGTNAGATPRLDPDDVRAFLHRTAEAMVAMQTDYEARLAAKADQIRKLEQRNRILAEALRRAAETEMEKLDKSSASHSGVSASVNASSTVATSAATISERASGGHEEDVYHAAHTAGEVETALPTLSAPQSEPAAPPLPLSSPSRPDVLMSLLDDLRARLDDSLAAEEHWQRRLTAHELLSLEERTRSHDGETVDSDHPHSTPTTRPSAHQQEDDHEGGRAPAHCEHASVRTGPVRRFSSHAIKQSGRPPAARAASVSTPVSTPARTHSLTTSPIRPYEFYPSPILDSRIGVAVSGAESDAYGERGETDGERPSAHAPRTNRAIHSPTLLDAWVARCV